MVGALGNKTKLGVGVAGIFAAGLVLTTAFAGPANTNQPQAQTTAVTAEQARAATPTVQPAFQVASNGMAPTGAPVIMKIGSKISRSGAEGAASVLTKFGCPVTIGSFPLSTRVRVETNGKSNSFNDPADAAGWALENCQLSANSISLPD